MLELIDITPAINKKIVKYPGHPQIKIRRLESIIKGDDCNNSEFTMCAHIGTHVDAPAHHYDGKAGVEGLDLNGLIGKCYVADLTGLARSIKAKDLFFLEKIQRFDILLLKTKNSAEKNFWESFVKDYIYLTEDAARYILDLKIKGIAIDCLGIEKYNNRGSPVHKLLLRDNKIVIIEGLDLRNIAPGYYFFICLPIKLEGLDGAPARAVLVKDSTGAFIRSWDSGKEKLSM